MASNPYVVIPSSWRALLATFQSWEKIEGGQEEPIGHLSKIWWSFRSIREYLQHPFTFRASVSIRKWSWVVTLYIARSGTISHHGRASDEICEWNHEAYLSFGSLISKGHQVLSMCVRTQGERSAECPKCALQWEYQVEPMIFFGEWMMVLYWDNTGSSSIVGSRNVLVPPLDECGSHWGHRSCVVEGIGTPVGTLQCDLGEGVTLSISWKKSWTFFELCLSLLLALSFDIYL